MRHVVRTAWAERGGLNSCLPPPPPRIDSLAMDYARAWMPKSKLKAVPLILGSMFCIWVLFPFLGPPPQGRMHQRGRHGHRPPPPPRLRPYPPPHAQTIWQSRAEEVKGAFVHAYSGYLRYAALHDELLPVSNTAVDKYVMHICVHP